MICSEPRTALLLIPRLLVYALKGLPPMLPRTFRAKGCGSERRHKRDPARPEPFAGISYILHGFE